MLEAELAGEAVSGVGIGATSPIREIPVKCRIRRNAEFPTLAAIYKNFHYLDTQQPH